MNFSFDKRQHSNSFHATYNIIAGDTGAKQAGRCLPGVAGDAGLRLHCGTRPAMNRYLVRDITWQCRNEDEAMNHIDAPGYGRIREGCIPPDNPESYYAYGGLKRTGGKNRDNASLVVEDNTIYEIDYNCMRRK